MNKGIIDNSGLRFYVTSKLRKFDAGIMELGLTYTPGNALPPGQEQFSLTGYCSSQCTETVSFLKIKQKLEYKF